MAATQEQEFPKIPLFRLLLDDVLLLLFLGVAIYAVSDAAMHLRSGLLQVERGSAVVVELRGGRFFVRLR